MHIAVINNDFKKCKRLLQGFKANPNIKNKQGKTSLLLAVEKGYSDIVKILLKNLADIYTVDDEGNTVFHLAGDETLQIIEEYLKNLDKNNLDSSGNKVF